MLPPNGLVWIGAAPYLSRKRAAQRSVTSRAEGQRRKSEISASGGCPFGLDPNRLDRRPSEASSWNALFVEFYLL